MASTDQLSKYFDAVNSSYDALVEAAESGTKHSGAIWTRLLDDVRAGQKDALALSEKVLSKPADPQAYGAVLEATMKSQERALAFAKLLFEEASGSGTEARAAFERVTAANKGVAEAAAEVARAWSGDSSFVEAWRKGVEAVTAASPFAASR